MSVLRNLSRNKTLMTIFKVLLSLVLISSVYMIVKNYHSKMVNVEHFSSFDSKNIPIQYSINGLLSVASGNFQHSTLKMELDPKISSNKQSLITLDSLYDEETNTVIPLIVTFFSCPTSIKIQSSIKTTVWCADTTVEPQPLDNPMVMVDVTSRLFQLIFKRAKRVSTFIPFT